MRSSYASSTGSSSAASARSTSSGQTHSTNLTNYSELRPVVHRYESAPCKYGESLDCPDDYGVDDPRSSVETYASTVSSSEDLEDQDEYELPDDRRRVFDTDSIPATPPDFAKLFPTTRRLLIQHDDSSSDGNMNIRCDTEAVSQHGDRLKMTLFHLRMKNLYERQFSLRRYCRDSGREVCNSKKKYAKPIPRASRKRPSLSRSLTSALQNLGVRQNRQDDEDSDGDLEQELRDFTLNSEIKATIPTNIIRLEFSNYAQVEVHRRRHGQVKQWDFEYWGEPYSWKRELSYDDGETIYSYELINIRTGECVAYVMPDKLDNKQAALEEMQGGWVPPSSMRITEKTISEDLGDVIVATGLTVLADDCIKRRWHSKRSGRVHVPYEDAPDYVDPARVVDEVFPRKTPKVHQKAY
jgi:hypothetical protein